jgi:lysophospholipase L1-like esterase
VTYDPRAGLYAGGRAFGLPAPALPAPGAAELELLVRFEHPAKFLAVKELPGAALLDDGCLAAAYGTKPAVLAEVRARLAHEVAAVAASMVADMALREAVAALPRGTFVALGDSITDDAQSWAEILRACVGLVRPGEVTVVNAGISGDTTVDALARLYGVVALRPSLVVAMLGTNDCQRHGPARARLVSPRDSLRAAYEIDRWLDSRVVWVAPPPVDEAALARTVGERPFSVCGADVAALTAAMRDSGLELVEPALTPAHLLPDGVHPSLAGQRAIAEAVLLHSRSGGGAAGHIASGIGQP